MLTLDVQVTLPDGSPAVDAVVASINWDGKQQRARRLDGNGRAQLRGVFDNGAHVHASSVDGALQTTHMIAPSDVRSQIGKPLELTLAPARTQQLHVESEGQPVSGAKVVAIGKRFRVAGESDPEGNVTLKLPANDPLTDLVAWHSELGVGGASGLQQKKRPLPDTLSLLPAAPLRVDVVDEREKPVPGLELLISVNKGTTDWIVTHVLAEAHARTDEQGEATVPWAPRDDLGYVDIRLNVDDWKIDEVDLTQLGERVVTVHVSRRVRVEGRVTTPEGRGGAGILVTGFAFGSGSRGDRPSVRTRADGTFSIDAAAAHGYILGIADRELAAEPWSGVILDTTTSEPASIVIDAKQAIPLSIRVTRGESDEPAADIYVSVSQQAEVQWTDRSGEQRRGTAGAESWVITDQAGIAKAGIARGKIRLFLSAGDWLEEREIDVDADEPVEVAFRRASNRERRVAARMLLDGQTFEPSSTVALRAWTERDPFVDLIHEPKLNRDGAMEVTFDGDNLALSVIDREKGLSGFARVGAKGADVEIEMQPMATFSGTIVDEKGEPLADRTLQVLTESSFLSVVDPRLTDAAGRFSFANVPSNTPLRVTIKNKPDQAEYYLLDDERLFEPAESREEGTISARRMGDSSGESAQQAPLKERVGSACANAGVSRMRGLVVLRGDDTEKVNRTADRLLNSDEVRPVLGYLPVSVSAAEIDSEHASIDTFGWKLPKPGEVVLVILDGGSHAIADTRVSIDSIDQAVDEGAEFLGRHQLKGRDAKQLLEAARREADASGRRVLLIEGGPRCGPCFRLARWIDKHHAQLEKDFVVVKLMGGIDDHVGEVFDVISTERGGIPWFAITEPDGTVLVTSSGPLGNIGMPSSVEGARHFRKMLEMSCRRLTSGEVDALAESLSK